MFHNVNNELFRTVSKSTSSSSSSFDDLVSTTATKSTASDITTDDIYGLCNGATQRKETPISQFASRVLEFSSQYGSDNSISYTACNITGRPSKYPNYGDFPETFAMVSDIPLDFKPSIGLRCLLFYSALTANGGIWRLLVLLTSCHKH